MISKSSTILWSNWVHNLEISRTFAEFWLNLSINSPLGFKFSLKMIFLRVWLWEIVALSYVFGVYISLSETCSNMFSCIQNPLNTWLVSRPLKSLVPRSLNAQFWVNKYYLDLSKEIICFRYSLSVTSFSITSFDITCLMVTCCTAPPGQCILARRKNGKNLSESFSNVVITKKEAFRITRSKPRNVIEVILD